MLRFMKIMQTYCITSEITHLLKEKSFCRSINLIHYFITNYQKTIFNILESILIKKKKKDAVYKFFDLFIGENSTF